jgi:hypothetical protein
MKMQSRNNKKYTEELTHERAGILSCGKFEIITKNRRYANQVFMILMYG